MQGTAGEGDAAQSTLAALSFAHSNAYPIDMAAVLQVTCIMTGTVQFVLMDALELEKVRPCSARTEMPAVSKVQSRS